MGNDTNIQQAKKLTKRQRRYLDAIRRCDWTQRNKDSTPAMRSWAKENELIIRASHPGDLPARLTPKALALLETK